jgi:hypothetical protein
MSSMDIEYNDARDLFAVSPDTTLGELLGELRARLAEHGQVISELTLDGAPLSAARERELADQPAGAFELLTVTGVPVAALVRHILYGLEDAIEGLQKKSTTIGGLLQSGKRFEALESLEKFIGDLESFAEGIRHCFTFVAREKEQSFPSVGAELATLRGLLERMQALLVAEEEVEFADLFCYEVPEHLASWRSFLDLANQTLARSAHESPTG